MEHSSESMDSPLLTTIDQCDSWVEDKSWQEILDNIPGMVDLYPRHRAYLLHTYAQALYKTGDVHCSVSYFEESSRLLKNANHTVLINLGIAQLGADQPAAALKTAHIGLKVFPAHWQFHVLKARGLVESGKWAEGLQAWRKAEAMHPIPINRFRRGLIEMDLGNKQIALVCFKKALEDNPAYVEAGSNWIMHSHYDPAETADSIRDKLAEWYKVACGHLEKTPAERLRRDLNPNRPLRIGIISAGFYRHPVGWMSFGGIYAFGKYFGHELLFYDTRKNHTIEDAITVMFKSVAKKWQSVYSHTAEELYNELLNDNLDILIDMNGHSDGSCLTVLSRRVAPVQVKWVGGLFNSTGLPEMDYLISDRVETPAGVDKYYTEKIIRMPNGYVTYTHPDYMPDIVARAPMQASTNVTFACFNNIHKINPEIVKVWSAILEKVPGSQLLLKGKKYLNTDVRHWVYRLFGDHGIGNRRIILEGGASHQKLLARYNRVDIALDPWPYTGGLTTVEALFMGVPVVTMPGPTFAGRHAASHLSNVGLKGCIADTADEYIRIAVELANRPEVLENYRAHLRPLIKQSPLCNNRQFAADLNRVLHIIWSRFCLGLPPDHIALLKNSKIPAELLA